ncbi:PDDEXK nuclease domain-containing protein [Leptolyngbya sp. AN03gr2]|uniref:PDDEXK nuclease domain-containing protein n=1 Tax=unclassified Leptolyngbya TaxID=2650499 RepID=UPI003D322DDF
MSQQTSLFSDNYDEFFRNLKERIRATQVKAALAVNQELVLLYWQIGQEILMRQRQEGWGTKVIERLAKDLRLEFPGMTGFSRTNLTYMRAFAEAYPDEQIIHQLGGQIPWKHNCAILDKVKDPTQRVWYIQKTIENSWSRSVLVHQIDTDLFSRQGGAITNFEAVLPAPQSELAQSLLKSEYNLDFLNLHEKTLERDLERALLEHIQKFLLELGVGFAFVGSQYRLEVEGDEFFADLLFYHLGLSCFVVIELKTTDFKPEYSGQINFYVNVIDDKLRRPHDQPTIGIILCRSKKKSVVEYALRGMTQPISVSTYRTTAALPDKFKTQLPSIEDLQQQIEAIASEVEKLEPDAGVE